MKVASLVALTLCLLRRVAANRAPTNVSFDVTSEVPHDGDPSTDWVTVTLRPRSLDPDGDMISHLWECDAFGDDTAKRRAHIGSFTGPFRTGTYQCNLTASDTSGASTSGIVTLTVDPEANITPIANAGHDTVWMVPHDESPETQHAAVVLDGTNSTDADGDLLKYSWRCPATVELDDGFRGDGSVVVAQLTAGTHTCTLSVFDTYGASSTDQVQVTVEPEPNGSPVADAGSDFSLTVPHDFYPTEESDLVTVVLNGSLTADPDNDRMRHRWECGNVVSLSTTFVPSYASVGLSQEEQLGSAGDTFAANFTHDLNIVTVMLPHGSHTCTLTTTDTYGAVSTDSVEVSVSPEPNQSPNAS